MIFQNWMCNIFGIINDCHLASEFRELVSEFGSQKYFSKCLIKSTKPRENGGECAILIHSRVYYHVLKVERNRLKNNRNIAKFSKLCPRFGIVTLNLLKRFGLGLGAFYSQHSNKKRIEFMNRFILH